MTIKAYLTPSTSACVVTWNDLVLNLLNVIILAKLRFHLLHASAGQRHCPRGEEPEWCARCEPGPRTTALRVSIAPNERSL